jgi:hypothetical protein
MTHEQIGNLAKQAVEAAQDPETQAGLRSAARVIGRSAIVGALGKDGLDIIGRDGGIKKLKSFRVATKALTSPVGAVAAARKATQGLVSEVRATTTSRTVDAASGVIGHGSIDETHIVEDSFDDLFSSLDDSSGSTTPDRSTNTTGTYLPPLPKLPGEEPVEDFWSVSDRSSDQSEAGSDKPSRRERIAGRIVRLHPSREVEQESSLAIPDVEKDEFGLPALPSLTSPLPTSREDLMSGDLWSVPDQAESTKQGRLAGIRGRLLRGHDEQPPLPPASTADPNGRIF